MKQQSTKLIKMGEVKQINIKNQTSYFYDIIDLKNFAASL